ncbi:hypothetical protein [Ethanoligenens harbinense]|uniref:Uncharacterized protein n=1 Tax=Ethanoligenens harbinense (strain DSM 18485 / JCM 12961 / CGMCC 1.5033 / YUAN-3) TaxID=663278 RepID=E6U3X4_ETHHY|nr:hypothetical protein [Ethanoligenens harbinense]ADU27654.1 hypothetical protein Ethha_2137 [Ethanoligenens harbinense YUAN-3]AVQ96690.1 hypothetical protein CXQ68_10945 [Ethanoligenens harbinense YUAN-3]AYF39350.1 hypothetical protein CXP51_10835 [Ethanoligenens harbinense]AYF42175.1 hypothetical protein CN246_11385 [Ethanoligenens harbinense]QCN92930.1 hypothetical protein DRA42_10975 [Ethanoligenens harbinense]
MQKPMRRIPAVLFVCLLAAGLFTACAGENRRSGRSSSDAGAQQALSAASGRQQTVLSGQSSDLNGVEKTMSDLSGTLNGLDHVSSGDVSLPDA